MRTPHAADAIQATAGGIATERRVKIEAARKWLETLVGNKLSLMSNARTGGATAAMSRRVGRG